MTTERFFKFTDGNRVYFRASKTKVYVSGGKGQYGIAFSTKPVIPGMHPVTEISKAEYKALVAAKIERSNREWDQRDLAKWGDQPKPRWWNASGPQDSWVDA
jgi:hypothetical protein